MVDDRRRIVWAGKPSFHRLCRLFVLLEEFGEDWDSGGGFFRNYVDERWHLCRFGVNVENRGATSYVLNKSGSRVDLQSSSDNDENISVGNNIGCRLHHRNGLLEKHDVGSHVVSVDNGIGSRSEIRVIESEYFIIIVDSAKGHEFAMKMKDVGATGAFVKVVDILGDYTDIEILFQIYKREVSDVGLYLGKLGASVVVEIMNESRVALKTVGRTNVHDIVIFPKAVGVAECRDATFCANTGSGRYY